MDTEQNVSIQWTISQRIFAPSKVICGITDSHYMLEIEIMDDATVPSLQMFLYVYDFGEQQYVGVYTCEYSQLDKPNGLDCSHYHEFIINNVTYIKKYATNLIIYDHGI